MTALPLTPAIHSRRSGAEVQRRKLNLKPKFESSPSYSSFKRLSSRRFQLGFHRVTLHRLTEGSTAPWAAPAVPTPLGVDRRTRSQGLTLVHIFAQPEPFLSPKPAKHPTTRDQKCSR